MEYGPVDISVVWRVGADTKFPNLLLAAWAQKWDNLWAVVLPQVRPAKGEIHGQNSTSAT